jgi:hypothetical protein
VTRRSSTHSSYHHVNLVTRTMGQYLALLSSEAEGAVVSFILCRLPAVTLM